MLYMLNNNMLQSAIKVQTNPTVTTLLTNQAKHPNTVAKQ